MIGWYFLMGALALLVTVLWFGFVGCGAYITDAPEISGAYDTAVKSTAHLVAYWRLGEPLTTPVPSSGGAAKDDFGSFHGDYSILSPVSSPNDQFHSPATGPLGGEIFLGVTPGLLEVKPQDTQFTCINTAGGYVQVPWAEALNPSRFTLEAWVSPDALSDQRYFYCLAESTGPQGSDPRKTGWGLYLGPSDINNPDPAGPLFWQVWMGDGNQFNRVAIAKPDFPTPGFDQRRLTYLALTFNGIHKLQLFLYFPDTGQSLSLAQLQALETSSSPINFIQNGDSPDGHGGFFIGSGSNLTSTPFPGGRLYPFKGKIQEVALYATDLSGVLNAGVQTILAAHEMSGGNF